jgi:hypothetical protein
MKQLGLDESVLMRDSAPPPVKATELAAVHAPPVAAVEENTAAAPSDREDDASDDDWEAQLESGGMDVKVSFPHGYPAGRMDTLACPPRVSSRGKGSV